MTPPMHSVNGRTHVNGALRHFCGPRVSRACEAFAAGGTTWPAEANGTFGVAGDVNRGGTDSGRGPRVRVSGWRWAPRRGKPLTRRPSGHRPDPDQRPSSGPGAHRPRWRRVLAGVRGPPPPPIGAGGTQAPVAARPGWVRGPPPPPIGAGGTQTPIPRIADRDETAGFIALSRRGDRGRWASEDSVTAVVDVTYRLGFD
jgi:hypothetical protein